MRKRLNVLLTVGGGPGVWGAMDALRRWPGQPVSLIVNEPGGAATVGTGLADRAVALPDADQDGYRDALVELCRSARIDVVVPLYDGELLKVADIRRRLLECGTRVLLPPDETVRLGSDKFATHRALIGTAYIPDFRMVLSVEELQDAIESLGYPREILCVRPHFGTGGRGIHLLDSQSADKVRQFRSKPGPWRGTADAFVEWYRVAGDDYPLLVTAFLPGVELGIDVLANDGRVDALVVRQKGGAVRDGNPERITFVEDDAVTRWTSELADRLSLSGLVSIDARYDAAGVLRLLEVNPRPGAYIGMSCRRLHLLAMALDRLLDQPQPLAAYVPAEPATGGLRFFADGVTVGSTFEVLNPTAGGGQDDARSMLRGSP